MNRPAEDWVEARISAGPATLVERVRRYFAEAPGDQLASRLASAAESARLAAEAGGSSREAATDLLAADGLLTLALLEVAEHEPDRLAIVARRLRDDTAAGR